MLMEKLTFAFLAPNEELAWQAHMLAASIRQFGGELAQAPVWALEPRDAPRLSPESRARLKDLGVRLMPFPLVGGAQRFPFAAKVFAAASAEAWAEWETALLVWMDPDAIVLRPPEVLLLPQSAALGYRPVDHTLIGSPFGQPVDPFWTLIYRQCRVPRLAQMSMPMRTSVDERVIRPYFNAGLLVVRPRRGLLRAWAHDFSRLFQRRGLHRFYQRDVLYRIFVHQAVLAGTLLAALRQTEMHELPYQVNYPLHMHADYPLARRPEGLDELVTCRYDMFFAQPGWEARLPAEEPLRGWIMGQVKGG